MRWIRMTIIGGLLLGGLLACGGPAPSQLPTSDSAAPAGALVLRMLYGSEKQAWLSDVTAAFNAAQLKTADGRSIFVEAIPLGSGESMDLIINGTEQADIWSPASS